MINEWYWWVALFVTSFVGFALGNARDGRKETKAQINGIGARVGRIEQRMGVIEATQVDPAMVRRIFEDCFEPTNVKLDKIEKTLESQTDTLLKLQLAMAARGGHEVKRHD